MLVSCICVCHNKPEFTPEAIHSILQQSYPHWEAVVFDSGILFDTGYYGRFPWCKDSRIKIIRSGETDHTRRTKAMAPWCYNQCFRRGLVQGDLVMYLCDDDLLYPNAFATFVNYCQQHPDAQAMYASQDIGLIYPNGWRAIIGERRATLPGGKCCHGRVMDGRVDYLQFCHKTQALALFPDSEYWPEGKDTESHADGIFMERIGASVPIHPIDIKVSQNRRTPESLYTPLRSFKEFAQILNGEPLSPSPPYSGERGWGEGNGLSGNSTPSPPTPLPRVQGRGEPKFPAALETGAPEASWQEAYVPHDGLEPGQENPAATRPKKAGPLVTITVACANHGHSLTEVLNSLANQTYDNLEVLVIDDGSAELSSRETLQVLRKRYPSYRFLSQAQAGTSFTWNRGLQEAHGEYFIPMMGNTLACRDMVERLIMEMCPRPELGAVTCYVLVFKEGTADRSLPLGKSSVQASLNNSSGHGMYHTETFRALGGFEKDSDLAWGNWQGFFELVNTGHPVEFLPAHLFYYASAGKEGLQETAVSQPGKSCLRPFVSLGELLAAEREGSLASALLACQSQIKYLTQQNLALQACMGSRRYRLADRLHALAWPGLTWSWRCCQQVGQRFAHRWQWAKSLWSPGSPI